MIDLTRLKDSLEPYFFGQSGATPDSITFAPAHEQGSLDVSKHENNDYYEITSDLVVYPVDFTAKPTSFTKSVTPDEEYIENFFKSRKIDVAELHPHFLSDVNLEDNQAGESHIHFGMIVKPNQVKPTLEKISESYSDLLKHFQKRFEGSESPVLRAIRKAREREE